VLSAVAGVFGAHGVSISAMNQGLPDQDGADLVFITHRALERDVQATLHDLRGLDVVRRVGSLIRVLADEPAPG
jgi:homoserine dehydrogenase